MAAVIKELSAHLGGGPGAVFSTWSLYVLIAAGTVTMLLASHALASGPLAASQPGFTIVDPLAASLLGVFLFGEHIQTDAAALAGEALALAVVIAGAAALSRSSLIAGQNAPPASEHQLAASSAASAPRPPARRRIRRTRRYLAAAGPGGHGRSARALRSAPAGRAPVPPPPGRPGSDHPGRPGEIKTLIPNRLRPDRHARSRNGVQPGHSRLARADPAAGAAVRGGR
jgi:hypothetical protein